MGLRLPIYGSGRVRSSTKPFPFANPATPTAAPKATNNATIIAMITTKVSIIEVRPLPLIARLEITLPNLRAMRGVA